MYADPHDTPFPSRQCAGGFDCVVELVDANGDLLDEMAARLGQPHTARPALEEKDAKVFLQRLDPCADARLADAERVRRVTEIQIFGYGERLDQRCKRNAPIRQ